MKYTSNSNFRKIKLMNPISWGVVCGFCFFRCVTGCKFQMKANLEMITWFSTYSQPNMCGFSGFSKGPDLV